MSKEEAEAEQRRLEAVRRYEILDTPPDGAFGRVAALAARAFGVPIATVTIVDEDRVWFKATQGLSKEGSQIPRAGGLCAAAVLQGEPYVVPDALRDAQAVENPLVRGELGLRFYAAAPLTTHDGYRLGTVNVIDTSPREVDDQEKATLQDLAAIVVDELELRLSAMRTVQLERELHQSTEANTHAALDSRAGIDQAIGIIMQTHGCDPAGAWQILSGLSQDTNTKIRDLAEALRQVVSKAETPHN